MKTMNGAQFLTLLESGANNLTNHHTEIDALNVFPVPDGDTGTNMNLTFTNGLNDAKKVMTSHLGELSKTLSRGLLMGARGNSGVILSQIFRGFAQSVESLKEATVLDLAKAFQNSKEIAYKAVMRPVEGTILTVVRESSQATYDAVLLNPEMSVLEFFELLVLEANKSLDGTPELLPVLKEVGVVDSGGKGYVTVLEGFVEALHDRPVQLDKARSEESAAAVHLDHEEFGYCTEFIIRIDDEASRHYSEDKFRAELEAIGNSLVVVTDEDIVKVHVHTLKPGNALNLGQQYGEFVKLKIENMTEQHQTLMDLEGHNTPAKPAHSKYAIVAVAAGEGIVEMFNELRADYIISGGQTMNPSTEDFVEMMSSIDADHIFVLPNNSNIIMAAKQAQEILTDKDIHVLETKSVPQGLSACVMFNPDVAVEDNLEEMQEAIDHVKTAQVTYAIKDTMFESMEIKKDDFMGILEKDIVLTGKERLATAQQLIDKAMDDESELVTLIYGEGVTADEAAALSAYIEANHDVEVELHHGNQPVYSYIIGIE